MEQKSFFARWRANFVTGLVIVLPGVISIAVLVWLFGTISNITDTLLIFIPKSITHRNNGEGPMYWYWSLVALLLAILLISAAGRLTRNYFGKKMIEWVERALMHVPFLNKIYAATKQVNDALASGNKNSFKTVVLVQFPREGMYSVGFITSEQQHDEVQAKTREKVVGVFVPTTPNPTSGFLMFVPETQVIKLEMSVADAIKYIVSLGSISQEYTPAAAAEKRGWKMEDGR
ncbi:MAG: DUF502 domain-containing protein [Verrucomicrobiota bacterium]|jgi:uncharacterized membrane protein